MHRVFRNFSFKEKSCYHQKRVIVTLGFPEMLVLKEELCPLSFEEAEYRKYDLPIEHQRGDSRN